VKGFDAPATLDENTCDFAADAACDTENECDWGFHGLTCRCVGCCWRPVLATGPIKGIA
jgi:hypothetical protein